MDLVELFGIFLAIIAVSYVLEMICLHRFNLRFYKYGVVFRERLIPFKYINWRLEEGIHKERVGKFVFIPSLRLGYFVTRFNIIRRHGIIGYSIGNMSTLYGDFMVDSKGLLIKFKVSYRVLAIVLLWYILLITYTFYLGVIKYIIIGFVFLIVSTLLLLIWFLFASNKASKIQEELVRLLRIR